VDVEKIFHESDVLKTVSDIPNVVRLVKCWNVQYDGRDDETAWIRRKVLSSESISGNRIHRRMLLTPCGEPLMTGFKDVPELVRAFRDLVIGVFLLYLPKDFFVIIDRIFIAHEAMVAKKVLHGDLSPGNLIIHEGKGYFIDFDHAKIFEDCGGARTSHGTVS